MRNWRTLLGLLLLAVGIVQLYTILGSKLKSSPVAAEIGCCIWMGAGIFLFIKGTSKKPD